MAISVRAISRGDLEPVRRVLTGSWGDSTVMALGRGELIDALSLPGFIAHDGEELAGVVTYAQRGAEVEIITIDALLPGKGVGRVLLDAVREAALSLDAERISLVTTNDNTHALRFYQRYGFDLVALHRGAVDRVRSLKPGIPLESDGIPIRHELELELKLQG